MGAWATDAFGNDDACDWAYELEESDGLSYIEQTIDKALAVDGCLEEDGAYALAAAEVIARLQGHLGDRESTTEAVDSWVGKHKLTPSASLIDKAHRVIDRVLGDQSELPDLWRDTEYFEEWRAGVLDLKSRVHA